MSPLTVLMVCGRKLKHWKWEERVHIAAARHNSSLAMREDFESHRNAQFA